MVPVPGDGRYEWDGYLPIKAKPNEFNPDRGYIETSNSNYTKPDYPYLDAIGFTWTDPYRWARGSEVLGSGRKFNMTDMVELQHDYLSIPARTLIPFFRDLEADDSEVEQARQMLLNWDFMLDKNSVEAGIYVAFERQLLDNIESLKVPEIAKSYLSVGMKTAIDMLLAPDGDFGQDPIQGRDEFLLRTLSEGIQNLKQKLGPEFIQLTGEDGLAYKFNKRGGVGIISVTANIAPKLCSDMQKFSKSDSDNEMKEAERIDTLLQPVHKSLFAESNPSPVKYAAKLLGLCDDAVRLPLVKIMDETKFKVKKSLVSARLLNE